MLANGLEVLPIRGGLRTPSDRSSGSTSRDHKGSSGGAAPAASCSTCSNLSNGSPPAGSSRRGGITRPSGVTAAGTGADGGGGAAGGGGGGTVDGGDRLSAFLLPVNRIAASRRMACRCGSESLVTGETGYAAHRRRRPARSRSARRRALGHAAAAARSPWISRTSSRLTRTGQELAASSAGQRGGELNVGIFESAVEHGGSARRERRLRWFHHVRQPRTAASICTELPSPLANEATAEFTDHDNRNQLDGDQRQRWRTAEPNRSGAADAAATGPVCGVMMPSPVERCGRVGTRGPKGRSR